MPFFTNKIFYKPGVKLVINLNDKITTVSNYSKTDIVNKTWASEDEVEVIPNSFQKFEQSGGKDELKEVREKIGDEYVLFIRGLKKGKIYHV